MRAKTLLLAAVAAGALMAGISSAEAAKLKIGFLPGVVDPFYQVMQLGVEAAAKDLGYDVVTQVPPTWGVEAQTPLLNALVARGDLNYIITAPVDKDQMVAPLQAAADAGIKIITVDTFRGVGTRITPVVVPPFYAVPVAITAAKGFGGVDVDLSGRVLDTDGAVIPGLYAAGELTGMAGGSLVGDYGFTGSLSAVVLGGRVAGAAAAAEATGVATGE